MDFSFDTTDAIELEGALCARLDDVEIFFSERPEEIAEAKAVCQRCPVRVRCLDAALRAESERGEYGRYGVYGGLTGAERARLARGDVA